MTRRTSLRVPLVGLAVLSLAACGPETDLDLDLRSVGITVPKLVTPAIELVEVAPTPPPVSLPPLPPIRVFFPPQAPPPAVPVPTTPPAPPPSCPKAGPFDAPDVPESVDVQAPPAPGEAIFSAAGAFSTTGSEGSLAGDVVTTVTALPTAVGSTGQQIDTWQVERKAASGTAVELYRLVGPSVDPLATAPGVYLVAMAWDDEVRSPLTFQPEGAGLQVLPVPVQLAASDGVQYVGSATDSSTLTTLSLTRNVTGRKRLDLCGELVDTFTVQMSGTLTTPTSQRQISWTQQLAAAYGAANLEETLTLTSPADGFTWTRSLVARRAPLVPEVTR